MRWFVLVLLLGCQSHTRFTKRAPANFDADTYECERDARMVGQGVGGPKPVLDYELYSKCMRAHGWTEVED
jgi:hypothetical protein